MHSRKTFLFSNGTPWIKKGQENDLFDVAMGCSDGAELCEIVGTFLLSKLSDIVDKEMIGLYRDDGLAALEGTKGEISRVRKKIEKVFKDYSLKLDDIEVGKKTNYLDVVLNLEDSSHQPYRKPNSHPKYIHVDSNHPKSIIEQVPKMVNDRLSMLSSGKKEFDESRDIYQQALNDAGHKFKLEYKTPSNATNDTRKHRRKKYHMV